MKTLLPAVNKRVYNLQSKQLVKLYSQVAVTILQFMNNLAGHEIAPDTGANVTKFFTLATKSWKLVSKLATRMFHHNLTKRYSELKRVAKINLWQTFSLSCFQNAAHASRLITRHHLGVTWAWTLYIIHPSVHFAACKRSLSAMLKHKKSFFLSLKMVTNFFWIRSQVAIRKKS